MKFEYPITTNYIRDWKLIDALREFGANALDAETRNGAKATITYEAKTKKLLFKNDGVTLSREALLLGGTENADREDTIGTYGEGMKMGFLVVARNGLICTVRNGTDEKWVPSISYSEKWLSQVLQLDITKTRRQVETFEIEVLGIDMEVWEELQSVFLKLRPAQHELRGTVGALLVDAEMIGRIYCKGVFVMYKPNYSYGYDFSAMELNRDRKFVNETESHTSVIWREIVERYPDKLTALYTLLDTGAPEGLAMKYGMGGGMAAAIAKEFMTRYPNAYIARNTDEAKKCEHYGIKAVVPGPVLYYVLQGYVSSYDDYRREHKYDVLKTYAFDELTGPEREVFSRATTLLRRVGVIKKDELRVSVVDFVDPKLRGLHTEDDAGGVKLSRRLLSSFGKTVTCLVHEFAHDNGEDGDKSHVDSLQDGLAGALDEMGRGVDAEFFTR